MDDSEKLNALKKAYADIILNTAKEAAARIMVSERRAMRFQQELVSTKEESLRMLLRLKHMLDSKVNVAEMKSSSQQKKIEELEAQLQEAEEIVRDLRAELRETQAVLEKLTKGKMHSPAVQNIEGEIAAQENCLQENRLDSSAGSVYSVPDLQFDSVSINDSRNSTVNATNDSSKLCAPHDHENNCYINNPDFASIIIRRKEPKLYRNGCTQRIRAFERNLFDGGMAPLGNVNDVQNETLAKADEGKTVPVKADPKTDIICETDKPDEVKAVNAIDEHVNVSVQRKGGKRRIRLQQILHSDKVKETNKASKKFSRTKGSSRALETNDPSSKNSSMICANEAEKDLAPASFPKVSMEATTMVEQSGPHNDTEKDEVFLEACSAWNKTKDDNELLIKSGSTRPESLFTESLDVPACRVDVETAKESSDKLDPKASDLDEKVSSRFVRVDEGKWAPVTANPKTDIICESETYKPDEDKAVNAVDDHVNVSVDEEKVRLRIKIRHLLHSEKVKETNKASKTISRTKGSKALKKFSRTKGCLGALDPNDPSRENSSMVCTNEAQKDLMSPIPKVSTDATTMVEQSGSHNDTEKDEVFLEACSAWNKTKDDMELLDKSGLTRPESLSTESSDVPACRTDVETAKESPDKLDPKPSDLDHKVSSQSVNDKFLKYTFRRKRKKEPVIAPDTDFSLENTSLKKKCGEKQNDHADPQNYCTTAESTRDSRRLAQVARQLISLSEKKWWQ